jgi:hypothetical protein
MRDVLPELKIMAIDLSQDPVWGYLSLTNGT